MIDFTTVLAVDLEHVRELELVWPTWRYHKPEILQRPLLIYCDTDGALSPQYWQERLAFIDHPDVSLQYVASHRPELSQRDKMLRALTLGPPEHVATPWILKIDTDVVATLSSDVAPWIQAEWFQDDPVFVASPWSYTKPVDAIERLDRWADLVSDLRDHPPLNIKGQPGSVRVSHQRVTSWLYFGRTDWHRWSAGLCGGDLPVCSHDTYNWFVAERSKACYRRVRMTAYGWVHCGGNIRSMRSAVEASVGVMA